jgi:hypothetical protein
MDREKKIKKSLEKFIPSRAKLSMEALFGTSEAERNAAQALLDALPKEVRTRDEEVAWTTECWLTTRLPCDEDLAKSPIGRATLAMLQANQPMSVEKKTEPEVIVAPVMPEPKPADLAIPPLQPPPGPSDDLGVRMEQERVEKREREKTNPPWKWTELKPSTPDKSLKPVSDWNSDANNDPIY